MEFSAELTLNTSPNPGNRARQRTGSYSMIQTPHTLSSARTHMEEEELPWKLHVPCSLNPSPYQICLCGSRCLLQKTSPPYPHQEHSCAVPSKQFIVSFLPCSGSPHTHLSAALMSCDGQAEESWAVAAAIAGTGSHGEQRLTQSCPSSSSCHSALLPFPAAAGTKLSCQCPKLWATWKQVWSKPPPWTMPP